MSGLRVDISATRGAFHLQAAFSAERRSITAVFGPSGSGKTSLLRVIAGLETRAQGRIEVNGACWLDSDRNFNLPVHRRRVGYVFQEGNLLTHLSVQGNLDYAWRRAPAGEHRLSPAEVAAWAGVDHLLKRAVTDLSGGERNRVALARALLAKPSLLLLDEPLAALDSAARAEWMPLLQRIPREHAVPLVYVSHALDEVTQLADAVVVLDNGRVHAQGPLHRILTELDGPLSRGAEAGAVIEAKVCDFERDYGLAILAFPGGRLTIADHRLALDQPVRVRILARDVSLSLALHAGTSILNIIPATVTALAPESTAQMRVKLDAGGVALLARVTRKSAELLALEPGKQVYAQVKTVALLS